uniref:Lipopolysaccharide assembly protein A domain-containing protein n=1 Tax=Rhizophora mucronata TaxID=61149 RepID=A0A2P2NUI8_RHIMU
MMILVIRFGGSNEQLVNYSKFELTLKLNINAFVLAVLIIFLFFFGGVLIRWLTSKG